MTDFVSYRSDFKNNGFVIVPNFLMGNEFDELTSNLDRYINDIVPTLPASDAFFQDRSCPETLTQLQHMGDNDAYFDSYRNHARWGSLAEVLLGEAAASDGTEWFNKPPGTIHTTPVHQDNYYFCLKPPSCLSIWLALDLVDETNGCLRYVRGSHRKGIRPHGTTVVLGFSQGISDYGPNDEAAETMVCLEPGDAVVHHSETIHRADPNRTANRQRRAFVMTFRGESCQVDGTALAQYQANLKEQHQSMDLDPS